MPNVVIPEPDPSPSPIILCSVTGRLLSSEPNAPVRSIITFPTEDHAGDFVRPDGGDWSHYPNNPLVNWNHKIPIGRGSVSLETLQDGDATTPVMVGQTNFAHHAGDLDGIDLRRRDPRTHRSWNKQPPYSIDECLQAAANAEELVKEEIATGVSIEFDVDNTRKGSVPGEGDFWDLPYKSLLDDRPARHFERWRGLGYCHARNPVNPGCQTLITDVPETVEKAIRVAQTGRLPSGERVCPLIMKSFQDFAAIKEVIEDTDILDPIELKAKRAKKVGGVGIVKSPIGIQRGLARNASNRAAAILKGLARSKRYPKAASALTPIGHLTDVAILHSEYGDHQGAADTHKQIVKHLKDLHGSTKSGQVRGVLEAAIAHHTEAHKEHSHKLLKKSKPYTPNFGSMKDRAMGGAKREPIGISTPGHSSLPHRSDAEIAKSPIVLDKNLHEIKPLGAKLHALTEKHITPLIGTHPEAEAAVWSAKQAKHHSATDSDAAALHHDMTAHYLGKLANKMGGKAPRALHALAKHHAEQAREYREAPMLELDHDTPHTKVVKAEQTPFRDNASEQTPFEHDDHQQHHVAERHPANESALVHFGHQDFAAAMSPHHSDLMQKVGEHVNLARRHAKVGNNRKAANHHRIAASLLKQMSFQEHTRHLSSGAHRLGHKPFRGQAIDQEIKSHEDTAKLHEHTAKHKRASKSVFPKETKSMPTLLDALYLKAEPMAVGGGGDPGVHKKRASHAATLLHYATQDFHTLHGRHNKALSNLARRAAFNAMERSSSGDHDSAGVYHQLVATHLNHLAEKTADKYAVEAAKGLAEKHSQAAHEHFNIRHQKSIPTNDEDDAVMIKSQPPAGIRALLNSVQGLQDVCAALKNDSQMSDDTQVRTFCEQQIVQLKAFAENLYGRASKLKAKLDANGKLPAGEDDWDDEDLELPAEVKSFTTNDDGAVIIKAFPEWKPRRYKASNLVEVQPDPITQKALAEEEAEVTRRLKKALKENKHLEAARIANGR